MVSYHRGMDRSAETYGRSGRSSTNSVWIGVLATELTGVSTDADVLGVGLPVARLGIGDAELAGIGCCKPR